MHSVLVTFGETEDCNRRQQWYERELTRENDNSVKYININLYNKSCNSSGWYEPNST